MEKLRNSANGRNGPVMKKLSWANQTHRIDIEFEDLCYTIKNGFRSGTTMILNEISGKFYSGEITGILGPSGSGKTTLLNVLAGYGVKGATGIIKINNSNRDYKAFNKLSAYIMQDVILQPLLTVKEAMVISAQLKLGSNVAFNKKLIIIDEILTVLGLNGCCETMTEQLSGGESRRLSIALELVSNPSVIFLDEPTTGLDIVAVRQCLDTLKVLTKQGRTIICSIHQPSASLFMQFNQVYFMANGMCVYSGSPENTVSYLSSSGLPCPTTYNPAEYIIEIVQIDQEHTPTLVETNQNGKSDNWHRRPIKQSDQNNGQTLNTYHGTTQTILTTGSVASFWTQFTVLLGRMMLQQRRNKCALLIQILHHFLSGILVGASFYKIGNDASTIYYSFGFCAGVVVFFTFTYAMTPILLFPSEVLVIKREYYNRWYGLNAYYLAVLIRGLPLMIILGIIFMTITYIMTGQPMEFTRFVSFTGGGLLIALTSDGLGFTVGSIFRVESGAIVGSGLIAPMMILSVYGVGYVYQNIALPIKIAMALSYMRFGATSLVVAVLANRGLLECNDKELLCPYGDIDYFLRIVGMDNMTFTERVLPLLGYAVAFKLLGYFALKYRLNPEISQQCGAHTFSLQGSR